MEKSVSVDELQSRFVTLMGVSKEMTSDDIAILRTMESRYPWFITPRVLLTKATGNIDPVLSIHLIGRPCPAILMENIGRRHFEKPTTEVIVDRFLALGNVRIEAQEQHSEPDDLALQYVEEDAELVSEELAEIYRTQGFWSRAIEIYRKLILLYPEKSVYFAELIAETEQEEATGLNADDRGKETIEMDSIKQVRNILEKLDIPYGTTPGLKESVESND